MKRKISRRTAMWQMAGGTALAAGTMLSNRLAFAVSDEPLKGNINHSVCKWCYRDVSLEDLCEFSKKIGITSIDLIGPEEWRVAKKYGLICAMANGAGKGIQEGFNDPKLHSELIESYKEVIPLVANAGLENLICFSGNRNGMDDEQGLENCVKGLQPLMKLAESKKVMICMELLNSKVNHKDYMCDYTPWGVELVKRVGSERFKLLYDIYHMQIMEGDIIRTIQDNHQYIAHYHTGGVPGRAEIDDTQELYYPAIMRAIVETGFNGFVAQEFVPKKEDALASLKEGVLICDV
jgi:hydroxypyruvate isomerase